MKKLILALACVMLLAGFAVAADIDFKGMYYARGSYIDNNDGTGYNSNTAYDYFYFDHELDITSRILVTDKTRVVVNFEIHDEDWLNGAANQVSSQTGSANLDDNIEFKRVFSSHTFDFGGVLDLGLMTGGAWMTGFGDNGNGRYRVKYTQPTQIGPVIAIYEKNREAGKSNSQLATSNIKDSEKDDGVQQVVFLLGTDATFGDFGFEAEFNYIDTDQSDLPDALTGTSREDYGKWGLYGNGWWNVGAGKVGLLAAYGSWDDDAGEGFGFGEDFAPTLFTGADWTRFGQGTVNAAGGRRTEMYASSIIQLYGSLAISEQFSINGSAAYFASNADENSDGTKNFWKDADGYEINAGLDYKITDAVTYTVKAAFGKWNLDDEGTGVVDDSPDSFARAYHRFKIDF